MQKLDKSYKRIFHSKAERRGEGEREAVVRMASLDGDKEETANFRRIVTDAINTAKEDHRTRPLIIVVESETYETKSYEGDEALKALEEGVYEIGVLMEYKF